MHMGPVGMCRVWPSSHLMTLEPSRPSSVLPLACPGLLSLSHGARVRNPPDAACPSPGQARPQRKHVAHLLCPLCYVDSVCANLNGHPSVLDFQVPLYVGLIHTHAHFTG